MLKPYKKKGIFLLPLLLALFLFSPAINLCAGDEIKKDTIKLYREEYRKLLLLIDNSVKLPLTEYNNLLQEIIKAENRKKEEEKKNKDTKQLASYKKYNITDGRLDCIIKDGYMEAKADLEINFLADGWKEVPLRILPGLSSIMLDHKSSPIRNEGNNSYTLLSELKGKHKISFSFHPSISRSQRRSVVYNSAKIEFNQRVPSVVNITYPEGAKPTGDLAKFAKANPGGGWTAAVKTDFTKPIKIEWFIPRKTDAEQVKGTYNAAVNSAFIVSEKMISLISIVQIEVVSGEVLEIPIKLPDGFTFIDSELPEGVTLENTNDQVMRLKLRDDAEDVIQILLYSEADNPGSGIDLSPVTLDEARRTSGMFALMSDELQINAEGTVDYQPIDIRLLPTEIEMAAEMDAQAGFKYSYSDKKPGKLAVSANKIQKAWTIDAYIKEAKYFASLNEDGILMYEMNLDVINNNKQYLAVSLPENTELNSAYVDNKSARPLKDETGNILIPMRPKKHSLDGLVQITLTFSSRTSGFQDEGHYRITFPKLNLPVNESGINIFLPKEYEYSEIAGNLSRGDKQVKENDFDPDFIMDPQTGEYLLKDEIGNLRIHFVDENGQTIKRAWIYLKKSNETVKSVLISNQDTVQNLKTGTYSIIAAADRNTRGYLSDISIKPGKTKDITIKLRKIETKISSSLKSGEVTGGVRDQNNPSVMGSGSYDNLYLVDGINTSDTESQTWGEQFNVEVTQNVQEEESTKAEDAKQISNLPGKEITQRREVQKPKKYDFEGSTNSMPSDIKLAGALSLKIEIPKSGIWYNFHSLLLIDEFPYLQFEYEKE